VQPAPFVCFGLWLKRNHRIADVTIESKIKRIKRLMKSVNLWNIEEVKNYIQDVEWSNGYKELIEYAYADWCKFQGFEYSPNSYTRIRKLPYIPTETEIDQIIASSKSR